MRQKIGHQTPSVVTTPMAVTPKVTTAKANVITNTTSASQDDKHTPQVKSVAAKAQKAKTAATTGVKTHSFTYAQKNKKR